MIAADATSQKEKSQRWCVSVFLSLSNLWWWVPHGNVKVSVFVFSAQGVNNQAR